MEKMNTDKTSSGSRPAVKLENLSLFGSWRFWRRPTVI